MLKFNKEKNEKLLVFKTWIAELSIEMERKKPMGVMFVSQKHREIADLIMEKANGIL